MMETISSHNLIQLICYLADVMQTEKHRLTELDAQIGDGDLGVTLACGFQAIADECILWESKSCSDILRESGFIIGNAAAGTIGTLFSFAFLSAARSVSGKTDLGPMDIPLLLFAAIEAIQKRGKAKPGQKTMLDALMPAAEAARQAAQKGCSLSEICRKCAEAGTSGAESTRAMVPTQGRARWFQERSVGLIDPGADAVATLLHSVSDFIKKN